MKQRIREDLQGLRGWAVLSVTLFHFFPSLLPWGYLGVDVFFVLSGFLIALVLDKPSPYSVSTYIDFYIKRIRRIVPLLAVVICVSSIAAILHFPEDLLFYNSRSAVRALSFTTNLKGDDPGEEYFRMLSKSTDLFTHAWSLAVEIQFYLVVPAILLGVKWLCGPRGVVVLPPLALLSTASLLYHVLSPSTTAFNSLLARLWQFLLGIQAFQMKARSGGIGPPSTDELLHARKIVLGCTIWQLLLPIILVVHQGSIESFSRILISLVIAFLLHRQSSHALLTHRYIVLLGDASYALYLIHWPILCFLKQFQFSSPVIFFIVMDVCIALSIVVHRSFEKWYMRVSTLINIFLILIFYSISFTLILVIPGAYLYRLFIADPQIATSSRLGALAEEMGNLDGSPWSDEMNRNISVEDAMEINQYYVSNWFTNLKISNCTYEDANAKKPFGICSGPPGRGSLKFMVIGNSIAANHADLIMRHFATYYREIVFHAMSACQTLAVQDEGYCPRSARQWRREVEEQRPDVLFIIQRWFVPHVSFENSHSDSITDGILREIEEYSKHTKRIFVLQAQPAVVKSIDALTKRVREGKAIGGAMQEAMDAIDPAPLRLRLEQVAMMCTRCTLYDIDKLHRDEHGDFMVSHPRTGVLFLESNNHYTPYGLRLVESVYEELNRRFEDILGRDRR